MHLYMEVLIKCFCSLTRASLQSCATVGMSRSQRATFGASFSSGICCGNTLEEGLCKRRQVGSSLPGGAGRVSAHRQSRLFLPRAGFKVNIQNKLIILLARISQQCTLKNC